MSWQEIEYAISEGEGTLVAYGTFNGKIEMEGVGIVRLVPYRDDYPDEPHDGWFEIDSPEYDYDNCQQFFEVSSFIARPIPGYGGCETGK
jgi:hypothetical protein